MALQLPAGVHEAIAQGWRTVSGTGQSELIPQTRLSGPMPWVIAIMVALTVVATEGGNEKTVDTSYFGPTP